MSQGCGQDKAEKTPPATQRGSFRLRYICSAQQARFVSYVLPPLFIVCKGANFLACPCCEIDWSLLEPILAPALFLSDGCGWALTVFRKKSLYTKFCVGVEGLPILTKWRWLWPRLASCSSLLLRLSDLPTLRLQNLPEQEQELSSHVTATWYCQYHFLLPSA